MSIKYFDADGRCVASFTKNDVYKDSRKYFQLDKNRIKNIQLNENFDNIKKFLCPDLSINFNQFKNGIEQLKEGLKKNEDFNNLLNNTSIPFILPKSNDEDVGSNIAKNYLPALEKSFKNSFPKYDFKNHCKDNLSNKIKIWKNSRYDKITDKIKTDEVIGLIFPCLNEFSFPAAIETLKNLPENFILAGGYEIISALVGCPSLLKKDKGYPPLLWLSSLHNSEDNNICYHLEPYGYNLTFNRRAHLNKAAEYWWHSIAIIV